MKIRHPRGALVCAASWLLVAGLLVACGDGSGVGSGSPDSGGANNGFGDSPDTDGDGLPDFLEDKNRNGRYDEGTLETDFQNPDTDGDGLSDAQEDS
ncbi:MAG: hypothetical protein AAFS10_15090, partial [Myxococcota bacterium]